MCKRIGKTDGTYVHVGRKEVPGRNCKVNSLAENVKATVNYFSL